MRKKLYYNRQNHISLVVYLSLYIILIITFWRWWDKEKCTWISCSIEAICSPQTWKVTQLLDSRHRNSKTIERFILIEFRYPHSKIVCQSPIIILKEQDLTIRVLIHTKDSSIFKEGRLFDHKWCSSISPRKAEYHGYENFPPFMGKIKYGSVNLLIHTHIYIHYLCMDRIINITFQDFWTCASRRQMSSHEIFYFLSHITIFSFENQMIQAQKYH